MGLGKKVLKSWKKNSNTVRDNIHKNATGILATTAGITAGAALEGSTGALVGGAIGAGVGSNVDIFRDRLAKLRKKRDQQKNK